MVKTLVANGQIWSSGKLRDLAVMVDDDGTIAALDAPTVVASVPAHQVIDATGQIILPGGVDMHVHVEDGVETFRFGTSAAARGGITTIVDIAPFHVCSTVAGYEARVRKAAPECITDWAFSGGIVVSLPDLQEMQEIAWLGAAYFKVFMPADPPVDAALLWAAIQTAAKSGLRMALHAEEVSCLAPSVNWEDPLGFPRSRPAVAETSATAQALEMARAAGAPIHICHVSAGRTADLVADYRAHGADVTAETTPHFLLFDESEFIRQGAKVKTTPPLRARADTEILWQALEEGVIDALACDHYLGELPALTGEPVSMRQKEAGIAGLELSLPLIYDAGVRRGRLSLERFVQLISTRPAQITGLAGRKGEIVVGADADFVFIDPNETWQVADLGEFSRINTTPYVGRTLQGRIRRTMVRGKTVWDGEKISAEPSWGRYTPASWASKKEMAR
ncbi:MAG: dihydroorotase family protein [Chloroflexi bacterium]|nr:dihydroorotase family protein [Chloroflexota bacterium]